LPLLYAVMRALGEEIFEIFKVPPKRFTWILLKLYYVFPNEGGFVDRVEFLQEDP